MGAQKRSVRQSSVGSGWAGAVESLWHMIGVFFRPSPFLSVFSDLFLLLSLELPLLHPPVWPISTHVLLLLPFGPHSHPEISVAPSPNFSLLEICQVLGGLALRADTHLWMALCFHWDVPARRLCGRSIWFISIPSWGGTVPCSSAIRSTYVLACCSASIPFLMPACSWAVGYQSCPLWPKADKFSWVRPSEGPRGRK